MKIIDAHLHFSKCDSFDESALAAGHRNETDSLKAAFDECGIVLGIAMGEMGGERIDGVATPRLPNREQPPFLVHCAGLESCELSAKTMDRSLELFDAEFRKPECVGLKLYPGYNPVPLNDPLHDPYFELAKLHDLPVVIHTGELAGTRGLLKYSHPLNVDELAVKHPDVRFVMAHYGNPWIVDATAVAQKNPNVCLDLSGLAEGCSTTEEFLNRFHGHMEFIRHWLVYLNNFEKVMYGSDWPLINIPCYVGVIRSLIPEEYREQVFFRNACRIFPKAGERFRNL